MRYFFAVLALLASAAAQQGTPPVRMTVINVCSPSVTEQKEIASALARIPLQPHFSADFEVSRGHTTVQDTPSDWVRVHRDLAEGAFNAAQYSYTREHSTSRETVVVFSTGSKDITQVAIEDMVTAPVKPATLLEANTPASRISLERATKPHIVLARCPDADQSAMEPLFQTASRIMEAYRVATGARQIVPAEVDRLSLGVGPGYRAPRVKPMEKR